MNPVLYILMRTDIASLMGGKGMAQAAHAANAFQPELALDISEGLIAEPLAFAYESTEPDDPGWQYQTDQAFGTTIVLGINSDHDMHRLAERFDALETDQKPYYGIVLDPTFPVKDGEATLLAPVETCMYVFLDKEYHIDAVDIMSGMYEGFNLDLYPTGEFPEN